jgi:hypothetical protein
MIYEKENDEGESYYECSECGGTAWIEEDIKHINKECKNETNN